ncbi:hypothetical protein [Bartonella tribocorum]|nr:hypothetical protein [Bartonella tribocorum]
MRRVRASGVRWACERGVVWWHVRGARGRVWGGCLDLGTMGRLCV